MMICSICGLEVKVKGRKRPKTFVCPECRAYFAKQRYYNELLLRIFKNDPTLKEAVA